MSTNKFQVIIADPPFGFSDKLSMSDVARGATSNYSTMSISDIKALPVKDIADPNGAVLALWVPSSLLSDGLDIMKSWGFTQKQTYIWVKTKKEPLKDLNSAIFKSIKAKDANILISKVKSGLKLLFDDFNFNDILAFGMGRLFRQTHEICLIGTNNNGIYKILEDKSQRSVCCEINQGHSIKPNNLHESLELMFPTAKNKLELFARRTRSGWLCLGNESPQSLGLDIRDCLEKLK